MRAFMDKKSKATPPPIPDKITYPFYDEPWWLDYSHWVREQKGWQCDECGISLKNNQSRNATYTPHCRAKPEFAGAFASVVYCMPC